MVSQATRVAGSSNLDYAILPLYTYMVEAGVVVPILLHAVTGFYKFLYCTEMLNMQLRNLAVAKQGQKRHHTRRDNTDLIVLA